MNDALGLIVTAIVAIWGILQTWRTSKLEHQVHLLNTQLDQRIQLLNRCRDAALKFHSSQLFALKWAYDKNAKDEVYYEKMADMSAFHAELNGVAYAINDSILLELATQKPENGKYAFAGKDQINFENDELDLRTRFQLIHKRIGELLKESTSSNGVN